MFKGWKIYLDQMFGVDVAQTLHEEGFDVLRASEIRIVPMTGKF